MPGDLSRAELMLVDYDRVFDAFNTLKNGYINRRDMFDFLENFLHKNLVTPQTTEERKRQIEME